MEIFLTVMPDQVRNHIGKSKGGNSAFMCGHITCFVCVCVCLCVWEREIEILWQIIDALLLGGISVKNSK